MPAQLHVGTAGEHLVPDSDLLRVGTLADAEGLVITWQRPVRDEVVRHQDQATRAIKQLEAEHFVDLAQTQQLLTR